LAHFEVDAVDRAKLAKVLDQSSGVNGECVGHLLLPCKPDRTTARYAAPDSPRLHGGITPGGEGKPAWRCRAEDRYL